MTVRLRLGSKRPFPLGTDGRLYAGAFENHLSVMNSKGEQRGRSATAGHVLSSPAIGAVYPVYVGSFDPHLYVIEERGL